MAIQSRSAALRQVIENSLGARIPAALSPNVQMPRLFPIGNQAVNALLGGGLPIGGICEFIGPTSGGRTSLALSVLSEATVDSACAYIDVSDSLDARSAAAGGVRLKNLLWVRFSETEEQRSIFTKSYPAKKVVVPSHDHAVDRSTQHHGIRHPRSETKGIDRALQNMLVQKGRARSKKMEGTPGCPNQRLSLAAAPQEQVAYEHFNARRADASDPLRQIDRRDADNANEWARERVRSAAIVQGRLNNEAKPWSRLDKALRTADQILHAGGFRVVVLDLASISPEQALRIPLATWYRFSRGAQEGDATLLVLTQEACARSAAKCALHCLPRLATNESIHVFSSMTHVVEVVQQRVADPCKKAPGRAVEWNSTPPWMRSVAMSRAAGR